MSIAGKFTRVSKTDYRDGVVMIGLLGNVYPHDLYDEDIDRIKAFYNMPQDSTVEFFDCWPEAIVPWYPAAQRNFINGFLLIRKEA